MIVEISLKYSLFGLLKSNTSNTYKRVIERSIIIISRTSTHTAYTKAKKGIRQSYLHMHLPTSTKHFTGNYF